MMNRALSVLCLCLVAIISFSQKQGLIIAIGDYPKEGKWAPISSENDVRYVKATLANLDFKEDQIKIILNEEATKDGIVTAFKELTNRAKKDDFVYIHYSGHGQQVVDDNNDEVDQLDEAIVPYDSPLNFKKGVYEGEKLLRDDELNQLTDDLREKVGEMGQVIFVMDACHSGTGTRGQGKARGTDQIMGESVVSDKKEKDYGYNARSSMESMAPMACFFGSSAQELNYETIDNDFNTVGSLTYAISDVLSNLKSKCTFGELFDNVRHRMIKTVPNQNPQWEGPKDVVLFENSTIELNDWIDVKMHLSKEDMMIAVGTLNGVFKGSTVEIIDLETKEAITKASVVNSQLLSSIIRLKNEVSIDPDKIFKARIIQTASAPCKINLNCQIDESNSWNTVVQELDRNDICEFTENDADLYLTSCGTDENLIQLLTKEGDVIYEGKNSKKVGRHKFNLDSKLKEFAIGNFIRNYEFKNSEFDFDVNVVPMQVEKEDQQIISQKELALSAKLGSDGFLHFKNGDYIKVTVKNNGTKAGYFSVLDIQGDNKINFVIPTPANDLTAQDYYLKPGESYETDFPIRIAPPFGNELIKLIASDQPMDLSNAFGGTLTRGGEAISHPFEEMIFSLSSKTRSAETKIKVNQLGTDDFVFKIVN